MQIHPKRPAVGIAIMGMVVMVLGLVLRLASVVAWGGAMLLGLVIARAATHLTVARVRASGFEMLWRGEPRLLRLARGESVEIEAEIRNRDEYAARFVELRSVHSPHLAVDVSPTVGEVPAGGRLLVTLHVTSSRVGRHGLHGLALELEGGPGLFEVPLTFANPYGIWVVPRALAMLVRSPRGGRNRVMTHAGKPGPASGDGTDLRELREHQPGDPFRRIAWKASARRRTLMVRDYEREERDRVWLLLDASVELWAGPNGRAPLDLAIDELASVAARHLSQQDRVGLGVLGGRVLCWLPPDRGPARMMGILESLTRATGTIDADRSDLDEGDVAARVLEHLRPLDPAAAQRLSLRDLDRLARRAERLRARAPFTAEEPYAPTKRERSLRRYLDAFGIGAPARQEPERARTDANLAHALRQLAHERPQPSLVYLWSPAPNPAERQVLAKALLAHPRRRIELRWVSMNEQPAIHVPPGELGELAAYAVTERVRVARERGERALKQFGLRVERPRLRHREAAEGCQEPRRS